ncbi:MAG: hypothetical protein AAB424_03470 [Patescibacteria group bacterium]
MIYIRSILLILLAFALHLGCTALVQVGWPPQPLVLLTVLTVWLDRTSVITRTLVPTALLVDILQPTHVPLVTLAVLVTWFVAALVQRQWLTNHSLVSLLGLTILSVTAVTIVTSASLWIGASLGGNATSLRAVWSSSDVLQRMGIEVAITLIMGILLRSSVRFFRSRFLYAPR